MRAFAAISSLWEFRLLLFLGRYFGLLFVCDVCGVCYGVAVWSLSCLLVLCCLVSLIGFGWWAGALDYCSFFHSDGSGPFFYYYFCVCVLCQDVWYFDGVFSRVLCVEDRFEALDCCDAVCVACAVSFFVSWVVCGLWWFRAVYAFVLLIYVERVLACVAWDWYAWCEVRCDVCRCVYVEITWWSFFV